MEFGTSNLFKANARPATHFFFSFKEKKKKEKKRTQSHPTIILR